MPRFRVKPKPVEARQWDGNYEVMSEFCDPKGRFPCDADGAPMEVVIGIGMKGRDLVVFGTQGQRIAEIGDWVVKKPNHDLSVVRKSTFAKSFDPDPDHRSPMRYDEVIRRYLAIREASSREWSISPTLVMTVEIDMSADTFVTMAMASSSSQRRKGPQFLRVTVFRAARNTSGVGEDTVYHGADVSQSGDWATTYKVTEDELLAIERLRRTIDDWSKGRIDDLPPSTSHALMDSLSRKR